MKVLVIGSGGREHAIIWKLKQSELVKEIFCAPGNAGISELATCVPIQATDLTSIIAFAKETDIDLTIVGMEDPLILGLVDAMEAEGLKVFGPRKNAALLEGSKSFSKDFMQRHNIPTAGYAVFETADAAKDYVMKLQEFPVVLKTDGLAAGKGVLICQSLDEALEGIATLMVDKKFGESGATIVIESFMTGPEVSVLAFCDGEHVVPMVSAQDHKRALDHDMGLNTGGMGTFSPSLNYTEAIHEICMATIYEPTIQGLKLEGRPYTGILYFGLMLTPNGPKVVEYNARFGDPEAQVVLPRLKTDLVEILLSALESRLDTVDIKWSKDAAVCVILASGGYPEKYHTGFPITGLEALEALDVVAFHAGTAHKDGHYVTAGGRVLGLTAMGKDMDAARQKAYAGVAQVDFHQKHFRTDIGIK